MIDDYPAPNPNLKPCPNCEAIMNEGESCPECEHDDGIYDCDCAWCISQAPVLAGETP